VRHKWVVSYVVPDAAREGLADSLTARGLEVHTVQHAGGSVRSDMHEMHVSKRGIEGTLYMCVAWSSSLRRCGLTVGPLSPKPENTAGNQELLVIMDGTLASLGAQFRFADVHTCKSFRSSCSPYVQID
jgi:hypothetical protein